MISFWKRKLKLHALNRFTPKPQHQILHKHIFCQNSDVAAIGQNPNHSKSSPVFTKKTSTKHGPHADTRKLQPQSLMCFIIFTGHIFLNQISNNQSPNLRLLRISSTFMFCPAAIKNDLYQSDFRTQFGFSHIMLRAMFVRIRNYNTTFDP